MISNPNRFIHAGFSPGKIDYSGFPAIKPEIGKIVIKNATFRPVNKIRLGGKYSRIVPGLAFLAEWRRLGPNCPFQNYYIREILAKKTHLKKSLRLI